MPSLRELLDEATVRLRAARVEAPAREAALLLRTLLGMSESALLAHDRDPAPDAAAVRFRARIEERVDGVPSAYLLGYREFWGLELAVDRRVLVPRPETEHLVEAALALALPDDARVVDVGTGAGGVALALATERPRWRITATDVSLEALAVARANAGRLQLDHRVRFAAVDLGSALRLDRFDLVVANLPYVDERAKGELGLDHEPWVAIYAGGDGRALIERFRAEATALAPGALLACEIGLGQADPLAASADPALWELVDQRSDLVGIERDLVWRRTRQPALPH